MYREHFHVNQLNLAHSKFLWFSKCLSHDGGNFMHFEPPQQARLGFQQETGSSKGSFPPEQYLYMAPAVWLLALCS